MTERIVMARQIGFLSEWQMYAQAIEGDTWKGEKMDKAKIDKMSGMRSLTPAFQHTNDV